MLTQTDGAANLRTETLELLMDVCEPAHCTTINLMLFTGHLYCTMETAV